MIPILVSKGRLEMRHFLSNKIRSLIITLFDIKRGVVLKVRKQYEPYKREILSRRKVGIKGREK